MVWFNGLIVIITFAALIRGFEIKLVLLIAGLLMAILSTNPGAAFDAFSAAMVNDEFVPVICIAVGFSYVMRKTGCEEQFIRLASASFSKVRPVFIPVAVLLTFAVNTIVPSAAGCAVVMGVLLIPLMKKAGIHPAFAAAAVLAGTWGSVLNPGQVHNPFIASLAAIDASSVVKGHAAAALAGLAITALTLHILSVWWKENSGYEVEETNDSNEQDRKADWLKALAMIVPLIALIVGNPLFGVWPWPITVPEAMIFGVVFAFGSTLWRPNVITSDFFAGIGEAYGSIIGITIAAAVFVKGMEVSGVTDALIDIIRHSDQIAGWAAAFGPFLIAVLTGSGDSAALAFNAVITPYAGQFGYDIANMGSTAFISGALGRSMSPLAGAAIACAVLAGVNPVKVVSRSALGMLLAAAIIKMILL